MKRKLTMTGVLAIAAATLSSCGENNYVSPPVAANPVQQVDTAQLLTQAKVPSDAAEPFQVDNGALLITDTSDSTDPIAVNGA